jgi:RNA polymerase sigma-70 factor, ECF subfamily
VTEQEKFMRLWTTAQPMVAGYIHSLIGDHKAAEDVLQETAMQLFREMERYDPERPFIAWAIGTAKLKTLGYFRDSARSKLYFDGDLLDQFSVAWQEVVPERPSHSAALQECLQTLAGRARELVRLRYFESLNATEIGKRLGQDAAAVRVALQRIRGRLRDCLESASRVQESQS